MGLRGSVMQRFFFLLLHVHRLIYMVKEMSYVCCDSMLDIPLIRGVLISNYCI